MPTGPDTKAQPGTAPQFTNLDKVAHPQRPGALDRVESGALDKAAGAADPLAEAEAALKRLRERPDDKQAADALERALQRLKERAKPEGQPGNLPKKF
jgi:hypothetical protein